MVLGWSRLALAHAAALLLAAPAPSAQADGEDDIHKAFTSLVSTSLQTIPHIGDELGEEEDDQDQNALSKKLPPGRVNPWCCYSYYEDADGWLRYYSKPANWSTAERVCKEDGAELAFVIKIGAMKMDIVPHSSDSVQAGDIPSWSDDFHFVIPLSYKTNIPLSGSMETIDWKEEYPFIGYKQNATRCGSADNGYKLDKRTGHCYKFIRKPATWFFAYHECRVHGGELVVINNETEAQIVREIFEKNPEDTISGSTQKNAAFIGVFKNASKQWVTLDDYSKTLKEIGYDRFASGEPNNARGNENCGSVRRNGELQDDSCDGVQPYICERETDIPLCPSTEKDERCDNYSY